MTYTSVIPRGAERTTALSSRGKSRELSNTIVIPSEVEGSTAAGAMQEGARIPPLRCAPVGMTWEGSGRDDVQVCHPEGSRENYRSVIPRGAERTTALSSRAKSRDLSQPVRCERVPRFLHSANAPVGMTWEGSGRNDVHVCHPERSRGIYRSWCDARGCEDSSTPLRSGRNDMGGERSE